MAFGDATFDTILAIAVFEHVIFPAKAMTELARVLKPQGYLYVEIHKPFVDPLILPSMTPRGIYRRVKHRLPATATNLIASLTGRSAVSHENPYSLPLHIVRPQVATAAAESGLRLVEKRAFLHAFEWGFYRKFLPFAVPFLLKAGRLLNKLPFTYYKNLEHWLFQKS